jgi:hypothetical protein
MELDRAGIEKLPAAEPVKAWLRRLVDTIEQKYKLIRDHAQAGGLETKNWRVREATARDVTDDNANAAGNLIVIHKTNGRKFEHEA